MKPSAALLVRIVPRSTVVSHVNIRPAPAPQIQELQKPTLIDLLMKRKASSPHWPSNIRLEPVVKKEAFKRVQSDVRTRLKKLLKER